MARVSPSTLDKYPPAESFTGPIVQIIVGEPGETSTFGVHKDVICFYSGYFDAAFNGEFAEADKKAVELPTEDVETVKDFIGWLYTRCLPARDSGSFFMLLLRLWVFGDAHQIPMLQNAVVNKIVKLVADLWLLPTKYLPFIYEHTSEGSKLRRLQIDMIARIGSAEGSIKRKGENWSKESLSDLATTLWSKDFTRRQKKYDVLKWNTCQYHVHEEGAECKDEWPA